MLDFNKAHSNSANASRRKQKADKKKKLTEHMLASCEGKVSFDTFAAATDISRQRRKSVKTYRRPYCCSYCHRYHLGA